jgi:F-type H+-transporting ATPase subunit epsilon
MPSKFPLEIMTPERCFWSGEVAGVIVNISEGEICVLAGHIPMLAPVQIGAIRLHIGQEWKEAFLSEGFMEVGHQKTTIFTQACEWPDDIDEARAREVKARAEEKLRQKLSLQEYHTNKMALARAMARLRVKNPYS